MDFAQICEKWSDSFLSPILYRNWNPISNINFVSITPQNWKMIEQIRFLVFWILTKISVHFEIELQQRSIHFTIINFTTPHMFEFFFIYNCEYFIMSTVSVQKKENICAQTQNQLSSFVYNFFPLFSAFLCHTRNKTLQWKMNIRDKISGLVCNSNRYSLPRDFTRWK